MRMFDFTYDGVRASQMGLFILDFDWQNNGRIDVGNEIDPNPTKAIHSDRYWPIAPHYDNGKSPFETEISLARDPCTLEDVAGDPERYCFNDIEINRIMRWLNRKSYHKFYAHYEDNEFDQIFYMATFNVDLIYYGSDVVGFKLYMLTNAPYAWGNRIQIQALIDPDNPLEIESESQDSGYIYMDAYIVPQESGDLHITNEADPRYVVSIHNAVAGNIYHMGEYIKQIEVLGGGIHEWLYDDFNFNFIRLVTRFHPDSQHKNIFHSTLPISIDWSYHPVKKVGMIG